jgi:hypothetical protein
LSPRAIGLGLVGLALVSAAPSFAPALADEPDPLLPSEMTSDQIALHNASLVVGDPAYIRCRRIPIAGSLVKKARVCRTNADWAKAWRDGNQNARDAYDAMNKGSSNSIEPRDEFTPPGARPN